MENNLRIVDDIGAEKALVSLKADREEKERMVNVCNQMILEYQAKIQGLENNYSEKEDFIKHTLQAYMETVETKETKTQHSYKLPSAKLIYKNSTQAIEKDDKKLLECIDEQYIKTERKIDWANYKKGLKIVEGNVINNDGEIVEGVNVVEKEGEFQIKF